MTPEEAVRAYHGVLERLKIKPQRSLEDDLRLQSGVMSYGGSTSVSMPAGVPRAGNSQPMATPKSTSSHDCGLPLCGWDGHGRARCHCDVACPGNKTRRQRQARLRSHDTLRREAGLQPGPRDRIFG